MDDPAKFIEGADRLTTIFGYWPSFHDAEVIDFNLWRGNAEPENPPYVFPTLTTKIHLWELTSELDSRGYYVLRHHTLATLRFHDISEIHMDGFNHQNAIFGLSISSAPVDGFPQRLHVESSRRSELLPHFIACGPRSSKRSRYPMRKRRPNQAMSQTGSDGDHAKAADCP